MRCIRLPPASASSIRSKSVSVLPTLSHIELMAVPTLSTRPVLPLTSTRWEKSPATAAWTMPPTAASNSSAIFCMAAWRSASARLSCSIFASASRRAFSASMTLMSLTARAVSPISSWRSVPGSSTASLFAMRCSGTTSARSGRAMLNAPKTADPIGRATVRRPRMV